MTEELKVLKQRLDNLSFKRHVIADEAQTVKDSLDFQEQSESSNQFQDYTQNEKQIQELNTSLNLLLEVFKRTKFDDFLLFSAKPARMFALNFYSGVIYGLGFAIGICIIGLLIFLSNPLLLRFSF